MHHGCGGGKLDKGERERERKEWRQRRKGRDKHVGKFLPGNLPNRQVVAAVTVFHAQ